VFRGANIGALRKFLEKERRRSIEAEARNIPFVPRGDEKLRLY
jgi:F-box and leucine-rich repeat protein GRR1